MLFLRRKFKGQRHDEHFELEKILGFKALRPNRHTRTWKSQVITQGLATASIINLDSADFAKEQAIAPMIVLEDKKPGYETP